MKILNFFAVSACIYHLHKSYLSFILSPYRYIGRLALLDIAVMLGFR